MNKRNFAFGRMNFILLGVGMLVVIIGFVLMGGDASTDEAYNPDIFSARRTKVAPIVCLVGFLSMIYAVVFKPKNETFAEEVEESEEEQPVEEPAAQPSGKVETVAEQPAQSAADEMAERTRKLEERLAALRKLSEQAKQGGQQATHNEQA